MLSVLSSQGIECRFICKFHPPSHNEMRSGQHPAGAQRPARRCSEGPGEGGKGQVAPKEGLKTASPPHAFYFHSQGAALGGHVTTGPLGGWCAKGWSPVQQVPQGLRGCPPGAFVNSSSIIACLLRSKSEPSHLHGIPPLSE